MLVNQVLADRVFIICGKTDMRKAINGLAEIVQNQYNLNPYESAAFLFCGRKADRMISELGQLFRFFSYSDSIGLSSKG